MQNLNLNSDGRRIKEPSGKRVTPSTLEIGKTYLHENHHFLRKIYDIVGNDVYYKDQFCTTEQRCSKAHFVNICRYEATEQEIEYIKNSY